MMWLTVLAWIVLGAMAIMVLVMFVGVTSGIIALLCWPYALLLRWVADRIGDVRDALEHRRWQRDMAMLEQQHKTAKGKLP